MLEPGPMSRTRVRRWWIVGGVALIAVAIVVAIGSGGSGHLKSYRIVNPAMAPALRVGQTVSVDPSAKRPSLDQIIVFYAPAGATAGSCGNPKQGAGHPQACDRTGGAKSNATFVKRVVGLPGDVVSIVHGYVIRNGRRESAQGIRPCDEAACNFPRAIRIPAGEYFVLGDNRGVSDDSRFWGPVPRAWIIGTVVR